ncbi:tetratricopeptide repeat protein [Bizionia paragorgiae]|uniref:Uncharacterized protein n=1 Tax=Bizionia paragorgiae TaxID=283786 RepID=A0A1H3WCH7_BIZPA|nr:tetratricopeptide repeat protein [Bizionia paragorgiae]SDZ84837.1 hypothetical protein SAMN04487990_10320 [Bizionia paragorgiae]
MNTSEFTYLLQNPAKVNAPQTDALKGIINTFPYFQSARALYLKGLKNADSFKYNQVLKTTAAYTTDRSILFDFITSDDFEQNKISEFIKHHKLDISDVFVATNTATKKTDSKGFSDEELQEEISNTTQVLDADFFQPVSKSEKEASAVEGNETATTDNVTAKKSADTDSPEKILNLGEPLKFNKNETHSFNEWLSLSKFSPIDRENEAVSQEKTSNKVEEAPIETEKKEENSESLDKAKKFELIEQFIAKKPKLKAPATGTSHHNIAQAQMIQPEALMTETLARIYVEQGNYKKAIQSYKILILKYPEKSGFFADQIKAIKQLQEQNNKQ